MLKTFFSLEPTPVDKLLQEVNALLSLTIINSEKLKNYQNQLEKYLTSSNESARTKRMITKTLSAITQALAAEQLEEPKISLNDCVIQLPSSSDLAAMTAMPAGGDEDQQSRLNQMSQLVCKHTHTPIKTTDEHRLKNDWQHLFMLINSKQKIPAIIKLNHMAGHDPLLQYILKIHPLEYLHSMINHCIDAQAQGYKRLNSDILITPKTFELSIKDLATTLSTESPLYFSFGLPSHHAFRNEGSGFCLFNKTAILMVKAELQQPQQLKYVIIGTDVNRDNGLCAILNHGLFHLDCCHIDVFDSRVYPKQNFNHINREFSQKSQIVSTSIHKWQHDNFHYYAFDLAQQAKTKEDEIHPALLFALAQLEEQIKQAKAKQQQLSLFLPTGWDSHQNETAYCGKFVDGEIMSESDAKKYRFNNQDLVYFYEQVLQLYKANKEYIASIYWGLEGGYDKAMYSEQIPLMLQTLNEQLQEEPSANPNLMR